MALNILLGSDLDNDHMSHVGLEKKNIIDISIYTQHSTVEAPALQYVQILLGSDLDNGHKSHVGFEKNIINISIYTQRSTVEATAL